MLLGCKLAGPRHFMRAATADLFASPLRILCGKTAGTTLPHGIAMAIGGMYPSVAHGAALAAIYPACLAFSWESAIPQPEPQPSASYAP
jgi:alcohol dehydrogenase class IV